MELEKSDQIYLEMYEHNTNTKMDFTHSTCSYCYLVGEISGQFFSAGHFFWE